MDEPMSTLSPQKINSIPADEDDIAWHDPPSSPFQSQIECDDQENIPPVLPAATPTKPGIILDENVPQSAFKVPYSSKPLGLKERNSPVKASPTKQLLGEHDDAALQH